MRLKQKLGVLGLTLLISIAQAKRWNTNKDSIIVDAQFGEEEDEQPLNDEPVEKVECITEDGQPGECVTMIRCHPILFSEKGQVRNAGLAITYAQTPTDTCSTQNTLDGELVDRYRTVENSTELGNRVVCCARDRIQYNLRSDLDEDLDLYTTTLDSLQDAPEESSTTFPTFSVTSELQETVVRTTQVPYDDGEVVVDIGSTSSAQPAAPFVDIIEVVQDSTTLRPIVAESDVATPEAAPAEPESEPLLSEVEPEPEAEAEPAVEPELPSVEAVVTNSPQSEETVSVSTTQGPVDEVVPPQENVPEPRPEIAESPPALEDVLQQEPPSEACPSTASYRAWPVFDDYPWLATIQTRAKTGPTCSGSLITESHVMTAAHCLHRFNSRDVARMQIRLGFTKRGENDTFNDYIEERRASKIIFHKRFHEQSKMDNNIALIKLDQPVEFNDHIAPIGVFNGLRGFDAGNCSAIEAGWIKFGNRRVTGISGGVIHFVEPPMSDFHLRESLSRVFNSKECSVQLNSQINEKMLCAKSKLFEEPNVSTDFFRWNDGGPLVVQVGNMIQQIGIKSWAYEGQQYPTVYTRVDSYLDWIRDNLKM